MAVNCDSMPTSDGCVSIFRNPGYIVELSFYQLDCQLVGSLAFAFESKFKDVSFMRFATNRYGEKFALLRWKTNRLPAAVSYQIYDVCAKRKYFEWNEEQDWSDLLVLVEGCQYGARPVPLTVSEE